MITEKILFDLKKFQKKKLKITKNGQIQLKPIKVSNCDIDFVQQVS
jgi:hypothetical protein